ncbi:MAG: hypothetical protein KAT68_11915 [Bacteroidales bacterium]|nr:hypothetical protein [Bacteroidales bacterium]
MNSNQHLEFAKLVVELIGAILLPIALIFLTRWFTLKKEKSDNAIRESDQISKYIKLLASPNKKETLLALLSLTNLKESGHLSEDLMASVNLLATDKDPSVAAKAKILLSKDLKLMKINFEDRRLISELLLPLKVHFDRTRQIFKLWIKNTPSQPNEEIEEAIKESNNAVKNILFENWHLIPIDLIDDASSLTAHYDAWLEEYVRLRPDGKRLSEPTYVFVGHKGVGFPQESEERFIERYKSIVGDGITI